MRVSGVCVLLQRNRNGWKCHNKNRLGYTLQLIRETINIPKKMLFSFCYWQKFNYTSFPRSLYSTTVANEASNHSISHERATVKERSKSIESEKKNEVFVTIICCAVCRLRSFGCRCYSFARFKWVFNHFPILNFIFFCQKCSILIKIHKI